MIDDPYEMLADAEATIETLLTALESLVAKKDDFEGSDGDYSDAYYLLVAWANPEWFAAREAIAAAKIWDAKP